MLTSMRRSKLSKFNPVRKINDSLDELLLKLNSELAQKEEDASDVVPSAREAGSRTEEETITPIGFPTSESTVLGESHSTCERVTPFSITTPMKTEPDDLPQPQCAESPVRRSNIFFGAVYSAGGASVTASSPGGEATEEEKGASAG